MMGTCFLHTTSAYRLTSFSFSKPQPLIKNRNFDPTSRTLKKPTRDEVANGDTVESNVKGLAAMIIAEDEKRRAQELVGSLLPWLRSLTIIF